MKNITVFENFGSIDENEAENLYGLAPIWLNNFLKGLSGYAVHKSEYGDAILTVDHTDTGNAKALDITVIFAIDGIDVNVNWTWGQDKEDIQKMAKMKMQETDIPQDIKYPEPGNGPKDYVMDVMRFIDEVEEYRQKVGEND